MAGSRAGREWNERTLPQDNSEEWAQSEGRSEEDNVRCTRKNDGGRGFSIWRRGDLVGTTALRRSGRRRREQKGGPL